MRSGWWCILSLWCASVACGGARATQPGGGGVGETAAADSPAPGEDLAARDGNGRGTGVSFRSRMPKPGHVRTVEARESMRLELVRKQGRKQQTLRQGSYRRSVMRTTVLETHGQAITRKRVEYLEGESRQTIGDREQRLPNPLLGKTYVIDLAGPELRATASDGTPVSDFERERLAADHPRRGPASPFSGLLPERPLIVGEQVQPDAGALAAAFGKDLAGVEIRSVRFRLEEVSGEGEAQRGRFALGVTLVEQREQMVSETTLEGSVVLLTRTSWPVSVELAGPVRVAGVPPDTDSLRGQGQVELAVFATYE